MGFKGQWRQFDDQIIRHNNLITRGVVFLNRWRGLIIICLCMPSYAYVPHYSGPSSLMSFRHFENAGLLSIWSQLCGHPKLTNHTITTVPNSQHSKFLPVFHSTCIMFFSAPEQKNPQLTQHQGDSPNLMQRQGRETHQGPQRCRRNGG